MRLTQLRSAMRSAGLCTVAAGGLAAFDPVLGGSCDSCDPGCSTCQTCASGGSGDSSDRSQHTVNVTIIPVF